MLRCFIALLVLVSCRQRNLALLTEADILAKNGDYNLAIDNCNTVLSRDSTNQLARFRRGLYRTELNDLRAAIRDFSRLISEIPESERMLQWNPNFQWPDDEMRMKVPFNEIVFQRGISYYRLNELYSALRDFEYVGSPKADYYCGLIYLKENNPAKACQSFDKALLGSLSDRTGLYNQVLDIRSKHCR